MFDTNPVSVKGFVKIRYTDNDEVIVDTTNDVLYGNMSTALAHALIGDSKYFLSYMGFGNGAAYVDASGSIGYRPSLGGAGSLVKNPSANLYNTVYVKKVSNESTPPANYNPQSAATIPSSSNTATNYEDIVVTVLLGYNEPPTAITASTQITQSEIDNSPFVGGTSSTGDFDPNTLVFNEIALYSGSSTVLTGGATATVFDVANFNTSPDKLMLTHVIFHPVQKSANRQIEIIYTLRIQMGTIAP